MGPDAVAPDGSEIYFKVGDAERASLVEVRLAPGMVSRPVRHLTVEEIWYVTSGRGRVWRQPRDGTAATTVTVAPGDALRIPTGWAFQFAAEVDGELRFACFTSPPWPGQAEAVPVDQGGLGPPSV
ncbi:MAG TPA: cupin domain-containing protein [Candidatus Dormibacteraeota bacterium]|nr:cupin domain-containing protein [Candidatus Dormibacteraeota bacterium]